MNSLTPYLRRNQMTRPSVTSHDREGGESFFSGVVAYRTRLCFFSNSLPTRTRTYTHPYDTKASAVGRRRRGFRASFAGTKKQRPCNAAATRQPTALSAVSRSKGCLFLHFKALFLPGVPPTSASRLPGLAPAVLLLLLAPIYLRYAPKIKIPTRRRALFLLKSNSD